MAKLITKFKFIKPGNKAGSYLKYIATREGVDKIDDSKKNLPASKKQKDLIEKNLRDFPDAKEMHEYDDCLRTMTVGDASEFITRALEDNAQEMMSGKTYADYIATRPRAQRFGSHGLFTDDGVEIKLSKVSEELNLHQGNVWTAILSLRREDAARLGFDDGYRWRDMLRTQTEALSKNLKIPLENLRWFAAYHDESHHPHVHLIAYSTVPSEGYLTKQGVNNLRSSFAKDIFAQDLLCVYEQQTERRDALKAESRKLIGEIIAKINTGTYDNPAVEALLVKLADKLSRTSGKKVYGYLKADVKNLIDSIVDELAKDERLAALYDLWYEKREAVIQTYTKEMPERVPLSRNQEFKSIRNAVIQEAMNIVANHIADEDDTDAPEPKEDEIPDDIPYSEPTEPDIPPPSFGRGRKNNSWWTNAYKEARNFLYGTKTTPPDLQKAFALMRTEAATGNGFAMHDLGRMYLSGLGCGADEAAAQEWFRKAFAAFIAKEKTEKRKITSNTASASCSPSATVWNRTIRRRQCGMKKLLRKEILSPPILSEAYTAEVRVWRRMMRKLSPSIGRRRSMKPSPTPTPCMSLAGCIRAGSVLRRTKINPRNGMRQHTKHSYAACCGVSDQVMWQMMKDNPQIDSVYLCLDNDEAGQKANKRMSDALFVKGVKHEILIPNRKDWNEDLLYPNEESEEEGEAECQALQL